MNLQSYLPSPLPQARECAHLPALDVLHDLPFSRIHSKLSSVRIPVAFRQQEGDEMNPRPNFFALQFPNRAQSIHSLTPFVHEFCRIWYPQISLGLWGKNTSRTVIRFGTIVAETAHSRVAGNPVCHRGPPGVPKRRIIERRCMNVNENEQLTSSPSYPIRHDRNRTRKWPSHRRG